MPGILGYDRFINSDGNAEFNLVLMDYRANNDGKIHNKNKRSGQIEVTVGRVSRHHVCKVICLSSLCNLRP